MYLHCPFSKESCDDGCALFRRSDQNCAISEMVWQLMRIADALEDETEDY